MSTNQNTNALYSSEFFTLHYDDIVHTMNRTSLGKARYNVVADVVGGPILFMGVGTGTGILDLCESGHEVTALDYSQMMLDEFQKLLDKHPQYTCYPVKGDQAEPPVGDKKFKMIIFAGTQLFHIPPERVQLCIQNCARLLAPRGVIYSDSLLNMCSKGFHDQEVHFTAENHPVLKSVSTNGVTTDGESTETITVQTHTGETHYFKWTYYVTSKEQVEAFIEEAGLQNNLHSEYSLPPSGANRLELILTKRNSPTN
eukprot:TRINITY_DN6006_c0_g2_i1.p1 TRINITY_DN6006_c0_g2~~TRINITY_DN6006_c0_g2_i1.p1  ORF type:complete len:256 (-),score=45.13 TRINITY_DN6006_c0_g2_i1:30-797(-)